MYRLAKFIVLISSIVIIFIVFYPFSSIYAQKTIYLEPIHTINTNGNAPLYEIGGISSMEKSKIVISDKLVYKVYLLDAQDSILAQTGARGKGPDEFSAAPANITLDVQNKKLAVLDLTTSYVNIYDHQLNFVDRIISKYPLSDIIYDDSGNLIMGIPPIDNYYDSIHIYNANNEFSFSFNVQLNFKNLIFDIFYIDFLNAKGQVIVVYQYRNLIQFYSRQGNLIQEVHLPYLPKLSEYKEKNIGRIKELPTDNMFNSIATDDKHIYILGGAYSQNPDRIIYVLSEKGKVLKKLILKEAANIIAVNNEYLYAANEATITKYKLRASQ